MSVTNSPPLTWEYFHGLFLEKYVPCALRQCKKEQFLALEKGDMLVVTYEAKFYFLSHYATLLQTTEKDRIHLFIKGLKYDLQNFIAVYDFY